MREVRGPLGFVHHRAQLFASGAPNHHPLFEALGSEPAPYEGRPHLIVPEWAQQTIGTERDVFRWHTWSVRYHRPIVAFLATPNVL